jgi:threonine dehydrogenase-like Zn-dependent dehydrogenase
MPLELIAERPGVAAMQQYEEVPLQPGEIRLGSVFSSVKHGTEFRIFKGDSADMSNRWDPDLRLHTRGEMAADTFPKSLGNMCLARVLELGEKVTSLKLGDLVFGHFPVRETHTTRPEKVLVKPAGISGTSLMYWDPADFAVGGIRDGNVRLGDRVAVFGLGAIGQMLIQAARIAGARWVAGVDPIEKRRALAAGHGADLVLDPQNIDAGQKIKTLTENTGVDVSVEASGSSHALYDALRATRYQGTVVSTAYYSKPMEGLLLSGEWHRNRIRMVSSRACSEPQIDFGWDFARIRSESLALLTEGRLEADDLVDPIVPFEDCAQAYMETVAHPERALKLGIRH